MNRIGLKESVSFCKTTRETVKHFMWECDVTKDFWNNLVASVNTELNSSFSVVLSDIVISVYVLTFWMQMLTFSTTKKVIFWQNVTFINV